MLILALDLATVTGVARGIPGATPTLETWRMPAGDGEDVGKFGAYFRRKLVSAIPGVDLIAFEAPWIPTGGVDSHGRRRPVANANVMRRLYGLSFTVESIAAEHGIECAEIPPATMKSKFAGHGQAKKWEVVAAARERGFSPSTEDEADACGVFWCAVAWKAPDALCHYDPLWLKAQRHKRTPA